MVLLPFEYQVRMKKEEYLVPQKKLKAFLGDIGISYLDPFEMLIRSGENSKSLYLFADGVHFSEKGHKLIYEFLKAKLKIENVQP